MSNELDNNNNSNSELLAKLSKSLELISKGDPIVSLRTELKTQFAGVETRFAALDKATELQHDDLVRVPTQVDKAVRALEGKHEVRFNSIEEAARVVREDYIRFPTLLDRAIEGLCKLLEGKIDGVSSAFNEKFLRIDGAFVELNRQTTVLRSTDQLALAAALQTAEKAVNKTELNTAESIKALRLAFDDANKATNAKIDAVTSRLDKGEGVSRGAGDTTSAAVTANSLRFQEQAVQHGSNQNIIALAAIAVISLIAAVGWLRTPPTPTQVQVQPGVLKQSYIGPPIKSEESTPLLKLSCATKPSRFPPCPDAPLVPLIINGGK